MSKSVLIVDSAGVMRMIIKRILSGHGFNVLGEAESGVEAVEKYRTLTPDFVTMGMVLREMDGMAAVREIIAGDPQAQIIMCTSLGEHALVAEAISAGAKSFITKPFAPAKMLETIEKVLR